MKLTRAIFLAMAFLIPAVSTVARAEDPKTETPPDAKKAKKSKKTTKKEGEEKTKDEGKETPPPPAK